MIKIGVQTRGIMPDVSIEKGMGLIRDAGFDCVDFNIDCFYDKKTTDDEYRDEFFDFSVENLELYFSQYKMEMERCGLSVAQTHSPFPIWMDLKWDRNDYVEQNIMPKSIAISSALGAPWMVAHPISMRMHHGIENEKMANINYFKSIVPLLKQYKVGVCLENLKGGVGGRATDGICCNPEEAIYYIETLNEYAGEELFGVCLDTGHLQVTKRDISDYIERVGKRIKVLHLHENNGVEDLHQMPFTFGNKSNSGLDWKAIAKSLKKVGYDGALCFETHPCMRAFPEEILLPALRTIHAVGEYLKSEIKS